VFVTLINDDSAFVFYRENVYNIPWAPLEEQYETCTNSQIQSLTDNLGIASGDISLIIPFWVLLLVLFLKMGQCLCQRNIPRQFPSQHKARLLDTFATLLLLERKRMKYLQEEQVKASLSQCEANNNNGIGKEEHRKMKQLLLLFAQHY
jgi:hypothetical protein